MGTAKSRGPKTIALSRPCARNTSVRFVFARPTIKTTAPAKKGQKHFPRDENGPSALDKSEGERLHFSQAEPKDRRPLDYQAGGEFPRAKPTGMGHPHPL